MAAANGTLNISISHNPDNSQERPSRLSVDDEAEHRDREATELAPYSSDHQRVQGVASAKVVADSESSRHPNHHAKVLPWHEPLNKFWRHYVRISVPHDECRDHFGESHVNTVLHVANRKTHRNGLLS